MYAWIWRRMPFGLVGKIAGMAMLVAGVAGLLWYVAFPAVDRLMPWTDVQVTAPGRPAP